MVPIWSVPPESVIPLVTATLPLAVNSPAPDLTRELVVSVPPSMLTVPVALLTVVVSAATPAASTVIVAAEAIVALSPGSNEYPVPPDCQLTLE